MNAWSYNSERISRLISTRVGSNAWAHSQQLIDAWRAGDVNQVMPLTLEFAPTLSCNLSCPECPYRRARLAAETKRVKASEAIIEDGVVVTTIDIAKAVLTAGRNAGVQGAIFTGGGEPTTWPRLPDAIRFSAELGMVNGLYTNAVMLGKKSNLARDLLSPECSMVFVRASINAVTASVAKRFSGAHAEDVDAQLRGLSLLFEARKDLFPTYEKAKCVVPSIQISVVVDENNVDDLSSVCIAVSEIAKKLGGGMGKSDDFIVRPLTKHGVRCFSIHDHDDAVIQKILSICGRKGSMHRLMVGSGLNTYLGFRLGEVDSGTFGSYSEVIEDEYQSRDFCWANGIFLTAAPDGTAHLCVDRNCYKEWAIGNLMEQSVQEVYEGPLRAELLERVHKHRCGPEVCEATCRTPRLNRIARMVRSGELTDEDVAEIRARTAAEPPLLLS